MNDFMSGLVLKKYKRVLQSNVPRILKKMKIKSIGKKPKKGFPLSFFSAAPLVNKYS
jgi:hypothetical protein